MKGVTRRHLISDALQIHFNPHTREGCDPGEVSLDPEVVISIHTPVKGVTEALKQGQAEQTEFQSTHP